MASLACFFYPCIPTNHVLSIYLVICPLPCYAISCHEPKRKRKKIYKGLLTFPIPLFFPLTTPDLPILKAQKSKPATHRPNAENKASHRHPAEPRPREKRARVYSFRTSRGIRGGIASFGFVGWWDWGFLILFFGGLGRVWFRSGDCLGFRRGFWLFGIGFWVLFCCWDWV